MTFSIIIADMGKNYWKQILAILGICVFTTTAHAQWTATNYWEFGAVLGLSAYQGELAKGLDNVEDWNPTVGIVTKFNLNRTYALRGSLTAGTLTGNDENSIYAWERNRNLNFRSRFAEFTFMPEVHFFTGPGFKKGISPYLGAGVTAFYYNPQTYYNFQWIDLQPLGTEGQGIDDLGYPELYNLYNFALPLMAGIEFSAGNNWFINFEFVYRFTLTDYLDDVGGYYANPQALAVEHGNNSLSVQLADRRIVEESYPITEEVPFYPLQRRGDPRDKDRFAFIGFTITKKFTGLPCNAF